MEIWKDIVDYEGCYQISTFGRIKSLERFVKCGRCSQRLVKERILSQGVDDAGYNVVGLCINGKQRTHKVSILVAVAFLNHKPNGHKIIVDHKDYSKLNNYKSNLQLISNRENLSKDKFRHNLTSKHIGVSWHKARKKWQSQIRINSNIMNLGYFDDELEAAEMYQNELKK